MGSDCTWPLAVGTGCKPVDDFADMSMVRARTVGDSLDEEVDTSHLEVAASSSRRRNYDVTMVARSTIFFYDNQPLPTTTKCLDVHIELAFLDPLAVSHASSVSEDLNS